VFVICFGFSHIAFSDGAIGCSLKELSLYSFIGGLLACRLCAGKRKITAS
jgi:ABC-type uncharacterized transport system permease subunit